MPVATKATGIIISCLQATSFKEKEEETCGPLLAHTLSVTNGGVTAVLNSAVTAYVTNGCVTAVLNSAVAAYVTNSAVAAVLNSAVAAYVTNGGVVAVLHGAIATNVAHCGVATVLHALSLSCETTARQHTSDNSD